MIRQQLQKSFDTSRNWGFINELQQAKLSASTIAIAGVGGVGGRIAVELTRLGIGSLRIADPDYFTSTNLNRQEGSAISTIGQNKAEVIAGICRDINPDLNVKVYTEGVNAENASLFVAGSSVLIEATDYTLPHLGVMLARLARKYDVPMISAVEIGYGATVSWFKPDSKYIYERHLGLSKDITLEDLAEGNESVDINRWLPHIPSYGNLKVLMQVKAGEKEAPAISPAVGLSSAIVATQTVAIITDDNPMPPAPVIFHVDAKEQKSRIIRHPVWHNYTSLLVVIAKSFFRRA
jgi:molybdopterin/thiamine biosynthesis adenylyltransferase